MSGNTEDVELVDGETVTVRGLTGLEYTLIAKRNSQTMDDPDAPAGVAIQIGLIVCGKTKVRAAEEAGTAWLAEHGAEDVMRVGGAIERLSGLGKGAQKSAVDRATHDG